jgi:hypothetical protein
VLVRAVIRLNLGLSNNNSDQEIRRRDLEREKYTGKDWKIEIGEVGCEGIILCSA